MSGRLEQLARQIRRLRSAPNDPARTLQRALHLASDIAGEETGAAARADRADAGDQSDFAVLASKGIIEAALAERLAAVAAKERLVESDVTEAAVVDLDVFLRSVENGAPAPPLSLSPLGDSPKLPPGTQKASVNISGRVVTLVGQSGRAFVLVDDKPIGRPFDLPAVPFGAPDVARDPDGTMRITWEGTLQLQLAADFVGLTVMPA